MKTKIPGHPNYVINESGQVFHVETREFIELLEGKYILRTPRGKLKVSYDSIMKSLKDAKEAAEHIPEKAFVKHHTVGVDVAVPGSSSISVVRNVVAEPKKPKKKEEGKFTLKDAVEKCGGFAPLEEIVEKNKINVDLSKIKKFRDQKRAVLRVLKNKA